MTMTSGFFDSVDHDRQYTAMQFGQIMDYLINDGVYRIYPESGVSYSESGKPNKTIAPFRVTFTNDKDAYFNPDGPAIIIGPGRAWFDHTWTWVMTPETVPLPPHSPGDPFRWDAVVLTMNKSAPVRRNYFRVIEGIPGANPEKKDPNSILETCFNEDNHRLLGSYMHNDEVHDVPIAFVSRPSGTENISQSDIISVVGFDMCPMVHTLINEEGTDVFSVEALYSHWEKEWVEFFSKEKQDAEAWNELYDESDSKWGNGWESFLDERSADFMRFIKMLDRIWHVWYQGSVNWVYEYIRTLNNHEEAFFEKWSQVITDAEELLEHGLSDYTQTIEDMKKQLEKVDDLVDTEIDQLNKRFEQELAKYKDLLSNDLDASVLKALETMKATIVQSVITQFKNDVFNEFQPLLNQYTEENVQKYMQTELDQMKSDLLQFEQGSEGRFTERLSEITERYAAELNAVKDDLKAYISETLETDSDIQELLQTKVDSIIQNEADQLGEQLKEDIIAGTQPLIEEEVGKQLSTVYKIKGSIAFNVLPQPSAELEGCVYNLLAEFTTDERFVEGAGQTHPAGTSVLVVEKDGGYFYDVLTTTIDVSALATKEQVDALANRLTALESSINAVSRSIDDVSRKL